MWHVYPIPVQSMEARRPDRDGMEPVGAPAVGRTRRVGVGLQQFTGAERDEGEEPTSSDTMTVIVEITVPSDAFMFGTVFDDVPDARVELEPVVPIQSERERKMLLVWVSAGDPDAVETSLLEAADTESVDRLTTTDGKTLFEVQWSDDINGIVQPLFRTGGRFLKAIGTADAWEFHLLFSSHESLSEFNMAVTDNDIPVTLQKLHNSGFRRNDVEPPDDEVTLSDNHRETLLLAYRNGYYEVPRSRPLDELAQKENVSDSALSKRLRRATASLIEHTLLADGAELRAE